jgi:hypothetical protein
MRACWLMSCLLVLAAGTPAWAAQPAEQAAPSQEGARVALERCAAQARQDQQGLDALHADCPGIDGAIHVLQLDAQLPRDWQKHVTARMLSDLSALSGRYGVKPARMPPDPVSLQDIASHLLPPPPNMWEQWRAWLSAGGGWWSGWRRYLPRWQATPQQLDIMLYVLTAVVALVAAGVIFTELRAAGVLGRRWHRRTAPRADTTPVAAAQETLSPDLAAAPQHLRPVLLLRSLVAVLNQSQRLAHERDLTCRELITAARFDTGAQRELFATVAILAERGLYGLPGQAAPPRQDAVLAEARSLEGQLLAPVAGQSAQR